MLQEAPMQAYEYLSTLGEGAYGEVWKCLERASGRMVAIKGFKQAHEDKDIMRLAVREAKMLESLDHPNLVKMLAAFRSKTNRVYMVFEFVGPSVHQELDSHPSGLPSSTTKLVTWQLLRAAAHLHSRKMLHRDIKPANVLMQPDDAGGPPIAKLCDFGFARNTRCGPRDVQRCTSYCVTRWYRAPEIMVGDLYGPSSDVWSIGCTIAEAATGRPLFPGDSTADQLWRIMRTLRERLPELEPRLFELVEACLKLNPCGRSTAAELLQMPYYWEVPRLMEATHMAEWLNAPDSASNARPQSHHAAAVAVTTLSQAVPAAQAAGGEGSTAAVLTPASSSETAAMLDAEAVANAAVKMRTGNEAGAELAAANAAAAVAAVTDIQEATVAVKASPVAFQTSKRARSRRLAIEPSTCRPLAAGAPTGPQPTAPSALFATEPLCMESTATSGVHGASCQALTCLSHTGTGTGMVPAQDPVSGNSQASQRSPSWASVMHPGPSPCVREEPACSRLRESSVSCIFTVWRRGSALGGVEEVGTPLNAPPLAPPPPGTYLPHVRRSSVQLFRPGPVEEGEEGPASAAESPDSAVPLASPSAYTSVAADEAPDAARDAASGRGSLRRSLRSAAISLGQRFFNVSTAGPGASFARRSGPGPAPVAAAGDGGRPSLPLSGPIRRPLQALNSFRRRGRSGRGVECPPPVTPRSSSETRAGRPRALAGAQPLAVHQNASTLPHGPIADPSCAADNGAAVVDASGRASLVVHPLDRPPSPPLLAGVHPRASTQGPERAATDAALGAFTEVAPTPTGFGVPLPLSAAVPAAAQSAVVAASRADAATAAPANQETENGVQALKAQANGPGSKPALGPLVRLGSRTWCKLKRTAAAAVAAAPR
ncbi:hypothetical protein HYH03_004054 [Edaphochlamys debaryana]|uniref:cyclin-dependent kinase n=1 Tax=Edaphochlamys debaryana TaxID=47281 RepID=A0A835YA74_9CHLO|nr:hypothetical protein HYH03_004054 [Edaphochlamys debaryana]|eukprot:KAG2497782.1 hypothetical protein HYH03_004054 [Edaphochlamys debaryana]